jgi:hypothetical protein
MALSLSRKSALVAGSAIALFSTPILANHGMGLRGPQPVPQHYGMQYNGSAYVAPQAQPYYSPQPRYRQPYANQQNSYAPPYVQIAPGIPVGNYQYASLDQNRPRLRGPSNGFDFGGTSVRTNVRHTDKMLDWQENTTGKSLTLLVNKANGTLAPNSLTLGAGIKGGLMWQKTSVPGQFPILSRFPDFSNRTDDQAGVFAINNAALAITGTFGEWTSFYLQPEYSETEFSTTQAEFQLRKAFVVFGNLQKTPLYAAFGRKTIDFGNFDGYNAFTQTEAQHYFHAVSDQPVLEVGYYNVNNGLKLTATAFSGGRQLRAAYAGEENNIGNYAASIEKEFQFRNGSAFTVGTSYLHDTIYRNNFTAHTFGLINTLPPPANFIEYRNSAVDAFAEYTSPLFDLMVEYTTTLEPWAAAIPQDAAGNIDPAYLDTAGNITFDQNLEVLVVQARIKPMLPNGQRLAIAAVGSWGTIGDDFVGVGIGGQPTTWEKNQQHALSVEYPVSDYLDFGAEYVYNKGFIPFVAPQLVSNDETEAHAINVGFKARF